MERKNKHFTNKPEQQDNDLGIGSQMTGAYRMMDNKGNFRVKRKGVFYWHPYQLLLEMSWFRFHLSIFLFYATVNAIFATIYYTIGAHALSGEHYNTFFSQFSKCYFFSVQTLTTVGYGAVAPVCFISNIVAAFEALTGLLIFALVTGLYYAKFTKPEAKILYSSKINITPYKDGLNGLMFRLVNQRNSQLIEVEAQMTFSWVETLADGKQHRRYLPLPLERSKIMLFPLNWTVVHPINEESPVWKKEILDLKDANVEILIFIKAFDITFGQQVQSSTSYQWQDINWAKKFVPMYYADEKDGSIIDLEKIDEVVDMPLL